MTASGHVSLTVDTLQRLRAQLPFRIVGLDSDNGTDFINHALVDYCTQHGITFTRSRRYLKNDTCHVEQLDSRVQLEAAQRTLAARAARSDSYVRQP